MSLRPATDRKAFATNAGTALGFKQIPLGLYLPKVESIRENLE